MTEADIRAALRDCYDPEIPLNLIDLGLLHKIEIHPDPGAPGSGIRGVPPRHRISVHLVPTSFDEAANAQLRAQVENRLAGFPEVSHTEVHLLTEPAWSPQRISPAGRRQLGLDQPAFAILNNRLR